MSYMILRPLPGSAPRRRRRVLVAALLLGLGGCDSLDGLLSVEDASRVIAADVEDPANATLLVQSAAFSFGCAFVRYVVAGGLVGEELVAASGDVRYIDYDRRTVSPGWPVYSTLGCENTDAPGVYAPLSTARWQADHALRLLEDWSDEDVAGRSALIAEAAAYSGYSMLLLGEAMCSAALDRGPELSREDLFARAEERFTRALEEGQGAASTAVANLSRVGRARARLDLGRRAGAAEDARAVPAGFTKLAAYSSNLFQNQNMLYSWNNQFELLSIGEAYRGLSFEGVPDPRVPVEDTHRIGTDQTTPIWHQLKYASESAGIPIASSTEARLILAEAEGGATAVGIINDLHAAAGLPPFNGTTEAEIRSQIIYERRAELFLQSPHLGDLIRYGLPLSPAAGTSYASVGGSYGSQLCFPLPDVERLNNPNIGGE